MESKPLSVAAGLLGLLFVGYCFYFDRKRRSDPDYRRKLQERRRAKREPRVEEIRLPDVTNLEEIQTFFDEQVLLAEKRLSEGRVDEGLEHIVVALRFCQQPVRMMHALQHVLPTPVFHALLKKIPNTLPSAALSTPIEDTID